MVVYVVGQHFPPFYFISLIYVLLVFKCLTAIMYCLGSGCQTNLEGYWVASGSED